ncbi:hypothetical protein BKA70DRAFT_1400020 [Coprinopsis sp. MPI-PUGE-AT-0042]|nr:hypothetical protein BKA70DRAFT_1400020 [Coprinopsis sp. MPI-PUGE-AT-0042]
MSRFQLKAVHRSKLLERYAHLNDSAEFLPYVFSADEGDDDLTARMEWLERFTTQSFPRPNIPRGLKLVRSHSFQPRFLYGWALDRSTMYKLGMQIGFVDPIPLENLERTSTTPGISLFHATVRLDRWLNQYLPETMKHLKWVTIEAVRGQHFQLRPDRLKYCIALSDSYVSGNRNLILPGSRFFASPSVLALISQRLRTTRPCGGLTLSINNGSGVRTRTFSLPIGICHR